MSLATRIESLVIRVAQEFNDVRAKAGNLANLTTTDKSNLVAAINELKAAVVSSAVIDDAHVAQNGTSGLDALLAAVNNRVRFDAAQSLTVAEQLQARSNIGAVAATDVGNTDTDFVAVFVAALV